MKTLSVMVVVATAVLTNAAAADDKPADKPAALRFSLKPVSQTPGLYKAHIADKPILALESKVGECGEPTGAKSFPMLDVTVAPDGTVSKVNLKPEKGFAQDTIDCVTNLVKTATFPARPKSKGTTVRFAMVYRK